MKLLKQYSMTMLAAVLVVVSVPLDAADIGKGKTSRGVWVTVFSDKKVHYSKRAVSELVSFCAKNGIDHIYFQMYRAGEAWFDSSIAGRTRYNAMVAAADCDPIDFLIAEAQARGIAVHAWINVLSIAQNLNAPIVKKYGLDVLTRDQRGRLPYKYNQGEDQLFLEPGDERVVRYTLMLVDEIIMRYPGLSGLHLDYIRYPKGTHPGGFLFMHRSGISYGFGPRNAARFSLVTGKSPSKNPWSSKWDSWKKKQVTYLAEQIRDRVKAGAEGWKVSCAVVPTAAKAASLSAQEWPHWLKSGTVDYVILMNYTRDVNMFVNAARLAGEIGNAAQVHIGVGVYMLKNMTWTLQKQLRHLEALNPGGIVFFAYDDICRKGISNIMNGSAELLKPKIADRAKKIKKAKKAKKVKKVKKVKKGKKVKKKR